MRRWRRGCRCRAWGFVGSAGATSTRSIALRIAAFRRAIFDPNRERRRWSARSGRSKNFTRSMTARSMTRSTSPTAGFPEIQPRICRHIADRAIMPKAARELALVELRLTAMPNMLKKNKDWDAELARLKTESAERIELARLKATNMISKTMVREDKRVKRAVAFLAKYQPR